MDGHRIDISKVSKKTRKIGTPSRATQPNTTSKNHLYLSRRKANRNFPTLDTQLVENAIKRTIYWRQRTHKTLVSSFCRCRCCRYGATCMYTCICIYLRWKKLGRERGRRLSSSQEPT